MEAIKTLGMQATMLAGERERYMDAKDRKAEAENEVLRAVVEAVKPALPAISSKIEAIEGGPLKRGIALGPRLYLGERGDFFRVLGPGQVQVFDVDEVLNETSLSGVVAVLLSAVRNQMGRMESRTVEIEREASILEGIALAFKVGGVR